MKIVLLCYINRSGSTFLCNQLSRFKQVIVCPEADILADELLVRPDEMVPNQEKLLSKIEADGKFKNWNINLNTINGNYKTKFELFVSVLKAFSEKKNKQTDIIIYKAERLFQLSAKLKRHHNELEVLNLVRDVRAVYNSQSQTINPFTKLPFSKKPVHLALYWNSNIDAFSNTKHKLYNIVSYEKIIKEYPQSVFNLGKLLGINIDNFDYDAGTIYNSLDEPHKKIHENIDKPPLKNRINEWENTLSEREIKLIEITSGKQLKRLNYPLKFEHKNNIWIYISYIYNVFSYKQLRLLNRLKFHFSSLVNG